MRFIFCLCEQSLQSSPKIVELLPPRSAPYYKYGPDHMGEASQVEVAIATELIGMTRAKKSARDIQVYIEEKILPSHGQKMAIEVATQTFLYIGSKSFTHAVTILEKYGTVLNKLTSSNQEWHVQMVEAVAEFWKYSAQMSAIVIDRMMGYRIVSNLAIVAWVFSAENVKKFHTSDHVWEVSKPPTVI
jgi:nuclear cap-binding protein subunit 1